ncbi:MAG: hypothetical protein FWC75_06420 [Oscillospiraceae bacterium]|nr:hypothetical protein [Oscillospiraceae bacterium]
MLSINATTARNEWSSVVESVIREKPTFIKRTRDYIFLTDIKVLEQLLSAYSFNAEVFDEDDGSITLTLDEIALVENAPDLQSAISKLAAAILEYSEDYYKEFSYWSKGAGSAHIPYVFKALALSDNEKIGGLIKCRRGKN